MAGAGEVSDILFTRAAAMTTTSVSSAS